MKKILFILCAAAATSFSMAAYSPAGNNIKTKWAAEVGPENARPEYPRPQMVRGQWQSLNGLWDYAIAPTGAETMPEAEGQILVPFCAESSLSGVCRRVGASNELWYRRTGETPADWAGKKVMLRFDAVDWQADVFVNGEKVCSHTGGYTAFSADITKYLAKGPAELVVRVWDPTDEQGAVPRGKQVSHPSGIWYTPVTGIWQSVWMEAVNETHIVDYNVVTDIDGSLGVKAELCKAQKGDKVMVEVLKPEIGYNPEQPAKGSRSRVAKAVVAAGEEAALKLRKPVLWTPDAPYLYGLRISVLRAGKVIDTVDGYTALRKCDMKKDAAGVKRMALNGEILFQMGPLDQGWWPDGLYTAPTAEAMLFDIKETKDLGFNMIRKHIKIEPSRWYYDCDREGILVWQDMPSIDKYVKRSDWGQEANAYGAGQDYPASPAEKANYYKEWKDILNQLRKFQCIVCWVPFNEAWGQFDTQKVVDFTKSLDPSRLVNAASGANWIKGAGDLLDTHHYPDPMMRILDPEMINVLGEYGGIGRPVKDHVWEIDRKWGYVQFQTAEEVTDEYVKFAKKLQELIQKEMCSAGIYTQTTDVEGEVNGFYTYDRAVLKMDKDRVREANRAIISTPIATN